MYAKTIASRVALIVAAALIIPVQAALAARPHFEIFQFDRTVVDTQLCGFDIVVHDKGNVRLAFHFDKAGDIEWVNVTTSNYRITLTNPANSISLWTPSPEHIVETAYDTTNAGLITRFVLPGVGLLALDAGRVNFNNNGDVTISGPHMLLVGDVAALCAVLAD
jgi:hypothetical protein